MEKPHQNVNRGEILISFNFFISSNLTIIMKKDMAIVNFKHVRSIALHWMAAFHGVSWFLQIPEILIKLHILTIFWSFYTINVVSAFLITHNTSFNFGQFLECNTCLYNLKWKFILVITSLPILMMPWWKAFQMETFTLTAVTNIISMTGFHPWKDSPMAQRQIYFNRENSDFSKRSKKYIPSSKIELADECIYQPQRESVLFQKVVIRLSLYKIYLEF